MPASPKSTKSMSDSDYNNVKSQIKLEEDQQPFGSKSSSSSSIFTFPTDQVQFNALQQQQQQHCEAMAIEQQRCNQQQIANENFLSQCNMLSKGKIVAIHLNNHQTSNHHHHQIDNHELITTSVSNTNSTNSTTTTITCTNFENNNANNNIINKTATNHTTDVVHQQQQQQSSIVYETIIVENNNNHHLNDNITNASLMTTGKLSSSTTTGGIVVLTNASLSELLNSGNDGTTKEKLTIINDSSKKSLSQSILMINSGSLNTAVSSSGTLSASGTPVMATNQLTGQKQLMFLNNNQVRKDTQKFHRIACSNEIVQLSANVRYPIL